MCGSRTAWAHITTSRSSTSARRGTPTAAAWTRRAARSLAVVINAANPRAGLVVGEYERHARTIDALHCDVLPGADGPILLRLRQIGSTGLAVGAFGEASDNNAHGLFEMCVCSGAYQRWGDAMAISPEVHKDQLRSQLRRVWGTAFARENARLKLARLEHVTGVCTATGAECQRPRRAVRARRDADWCFHTSGRPGAHVGGVGHGRHRGG